MKLGVPLQLRTTPAGSPAAARRRPLRLPQALLGAALLAGAAALRAAATTDGSMGAVQRLSGSFTVPQSLGTVKGGNLFHSFAQFGIAAGETATFTTQDAGIRHVIGRVTGGEASLLLGPLKLEAAAGARPDFWFVNPSGITVGAGARFDVPAGLHLATAPLLKLADGQDFDARGGSASALSVAAPERFGFLGGQSAAALRWQGSPVELQAGGALDIAAGELSLQQSVLSAPGGTIRVLAQRGVELSDQAYLYASSGNQPGSGTIQVDAGSLRVASGGGAPSGLITEADTSARVASGGIELRLGGVLTIAEGSQISARSASTLAAGRLNVQAGSLSIDGRGQDTSLGSWAFGDGRGAALTLDVAGAVSLANGGQIFSTTSGAGSGGALDIRAGSLALDGQGYFAFIGTQALGGASQPAAPLQLQVRDALQLSAGGQIASFGTASVAPGAIDVAAGSMRIDAQRSGQSTGINSYGAAPLNVAVQGLLELHDGAAIASSSSSARPPGALRVSAGSAILDGAGGVAQITALSTSGRDAADVQLNVAEGLQLRSGGQVSSSTLGSGAAGRVQVTAREIEMSGGPGAVTGVFASSLAAEGGAAGDVRVDAGRIAIRSGARISAASISDSNGAGSVSVRADSVLLDGAGVATGIESLAYGLAGDAGRVNIEAREQLVLRDGASVITSALGLGGSGLIQVQTGSLLIDGAGARDTYTGIGGDALGAGAGGAVAIEAKRIELREGGQISSATFSSANAGSVRISADRLSVDGGGNTAVASGISADSGGAGRAGDIDIRVREMSVANEGMVSSSALGSGAGGGIRIDAGQLTLSTTGGIFTVAAGSGAAGSIELKVADRLRLEQGGVIAANTGGSGAAGRVSVQAGSFLATGSDPRDGARSRIVSRARAESGGQTGSITLDIGGRLELRDGALLSIANDAPVAQPAALAPSALTLRGGSILLADAELTAASSANADAGAISITSHGELRVERSSIRTTALDGDGGPISLAAQGLVRLQDARITTSVEGLSSGNGGSITLAGQALLLESGFVQANTAAPLARGGRVDIRVGALLPNGNNVFIGGQRIESFRAGVAGYNVIQAAAPDGVGGVLDISFPQLDLSGSLVGLSTQRIDFGALARDICRIGDDSSFTVLSGRMPLANRAGPP